MPYRTPADPQESLRPTAALHEAGTRPNAEGPDAPRAADHNAVAAWLAHVEAGRIGSHLRPIAALLEANPPMADEHRERILANERLMRPHPMGHR